MTIAHISPAGVFTPVVEDFTEDTPHVAQLRNAEGSLVAIEGRSATVEWTPDGSFIKVRKPSVFAIASSVRTPSKRGFVSGFSGDSRRRLLQLLARIQRDQLPVFCTLTYPGEFSGDGKRWKRDLDVFAKRFRKEFPYAAFIWKLEAQQRGAPHYHLLVYCSKMPIVMLYTHLRTWLPAAWYEIVASGDERHLRFGTRVEYIRSRAGVLHYAAKYMTKVVGAEGWSNPGRFWGIVARDNLPLAVPLVATIYYSVACTLTRWLRRFRNLPGRDYSSLWAVVAEPDRWVRELLRVDYSGGVV